MNCPKCGKSYLSAMRFGEPDSVGIIGATVHAYKTVTRLDGSTGRLPSEICFLVREQFKLICDECLRCHALYPVEVTAVDEKGCPECRPTEVPYDEPL